MTKTVFAYLPAGTLYRAGTRQTVQGYSPYNSTLYYPSTSKVKKIGTAHYSSTHYKGNGSYVYGRGDSVEARTGMYKYSGALYDADGVRVNGSTSYYFGGSSGTYYKGNGSSGYLRGDSVDAIRYDGTLYEAGSEVTPISTGVTGLYYQNDDESWSYTPIGTAVTDAYQRLPEDDQTFVSIGDECTLNLANFTTRGATLLQA